jgi:hypothetical protein
MAMRRRRLLAPVADISLVTHSCSDKAEAVSGRRTNRGRAYNERVKHSPAIQHLPDAVGRVARMPLLRGVCNPLTTGRRVAADGPPFPPPDITNAASITGQSMPSGLALHQVWSSTRSRVSRSNGSSNRDPAVNRRQLGREHEARQAEVPPGDHRREEAATIAAIAGRS